MAWGRTSIALISFGFTFYKFFEYLGQNVPSAGAAMHGPRNVGLGLIALGTLLQAISAVQGLKLHKQLRETVKLDLPRIPGALILSLSVMLFGLAAAFLILFPTGLF